MIPFSVLDLAPIPQGGDAARALRNTRDLAQHAERLGYNRFWLAEHHNMTGIASAATAVVIGHVAGGTSTIRVGSGGIMLPNHAPLVIAEQFGTLASLYPGRIDLGLGRAPGTDQLTSRALRRHLGSVDDFPRDVLELQSYFRPASPGQMVRAVPGAGLEVPIWLLGSSTFSAELAAGLGLPFAFASHFAPQLLEPAVEMYRAHFRPSTELARPYVMRAVTGVAAATAAAGKRLFTSMQQQFINLRRGTAGPLPPPVDSMDSICSPAELAGLQQMLSRSFVGSKETVRRGVKRFIQELSPDEIMVTGHIFDHAARVRSFEIAAQVREELAAESGTAAA